MGSLKKNEENVKLIPEDASAAAVEASVGKKKKKRKLKEVAEQPASSADPTPIEPRKKKKRKVQDGAEKTVPTEPPAAKPESGKKKKKRKTDESKPAGDPDADSAEKSVRKKKLKEKKWQKKMEAKKAKAAADAEAKAAGKTPDDEAGKKKKKAAKEDSDDDSFFAGEGDKKHGDPKEKKERKIPDHLNPMKVFVGGLPYKATEKGVRAHFAQFGTIERMDMPLNDKGMASGNAFIYYSKEEEVAKAVELHGTEFEGRQIKVMRAQKQNKDGKGKGKGKGAKGKGKPEAGGDDNSTTKSGKPRNDQTTVFVGGLPYDMDLLTIQQDFQECGEVAAVRMVKNQDGEFKGIVFVVFKDEAGVKAALEYDGTNYGGRAIRVHRAGEKPEAGKGKDGKGKARRVEGKAGICYKFQAGSCPHGDSCIFKHEQSDK